MAVACSDEGDDGVASIVFLPWFSVCVVKVNALFVPDPGFRALVDGGECGNGGDGNSGDKDVGFKHV
ncbi:MAG TPA: hypothetical protein DIT58_12385 [Porticoccaceae bacterium]|nr:hypothetical protein [Porticoccaceae bacterium]